MENMDKDRINRWKCLICGSTQKKKIDLIGISNNEIGYSLLCCNCGHVDSFALTSSAVSAMICGDESKVAKTKITCGAGSSNMKFCLNKKCPYRIKKDEKKDKQGSIDPVPNPLTDDVGLIPRKYN